LTLDLTNWVIGLNVTPIEERGTPLATVRSYATFRTPLGALVNAVRRFGKFIEQAHKGSYAALCAAALLVVALGICSFHGSPSDCDTHQPSPDVCATLLMVVAPILLLAQPALNGRVVSLWSPSRYVVPLDLLYRPPKPVSF
jgi:hypothetical protein